VAASSYGAMKVLKMILTFPGRARQMADDNTKFLEEQWFTKC